MGRIGPADVDRALRCQHAAEQAASFAIAAAGMEGVPHEQLIDQLITARRTLNVVADNPAQLKELTELVVDRMAAAGDSPDRGAHFGSYDRAAAVLADAVDGAVLHQEALYGWRAGEGLVPSVMDSESTEALSAVRQIAERLRSEPAEAAAAAIEERIGHGDADAAIALASSAIDHVAARAPERAGLLVDALDRRASDARAAGRSDDAEALGRFANEADALVGILTGTSAVDVVALLGGTAEVGDIAEGPAPVGLTDERAGAELEVLPLDEDYSGSRSPHDEFSTTSGDPGLWVEPEPEAEQIGDVGDQFEI